MLDTNICLINVLKMADLVFGRQDEIKEILLSHKDTTLEIIKKTAKHNFKNVHQLSQTLFY